MHRDLDRLVGLSYVVSSPAVITHAMAIPPAPVKSTSLPAPAASDFEPPAQHGRGDATFVSADGAVYSLHRKQLARRSDTFSDAQDFGTDAEPCKLAERAVVLDGLLPYLYGMGLADDVLRLPPDVAIDVYAAALKYQLDASVISGLGLALACVLKGTGRSDAAQPAEDAVRAAQPSTLPARRQQRRCRPLRRSSPRAHQVVAHRS